LCRKVDEAKIAALLFAPHLPCSPSCHLLFLLLLHLPSSIFRTRSANNLLSIHHRQEIICDPQLLSAAANTHQSHRRQPCLAHVRVLKSRRSPITSSGHTYFSIDNTSRNSTNESRRRAGVSVLISFTRTAPTYGDVQPTPWAGSCPERWKCSSERVAGWHPARI
jgi:hypothetical protein